MIYLIIFWTLFIAFVITVETAKRIDSEKARKLTYQLQDKSFLFFMFLGLLVFMAVITKDPIAFGELTLPMEMQWIVALLAFACGAWMHYFNPIKERVMVLEKDMSSIKTNIASIKTDVHLIKETLLSRNPKARRA